MLIIKVNEDRLGLIQCHDKLGQYRHLVGTHDEEWQWRRLLTGDLDIDSENLRTGVINESWGITSRTSLDG